MRSISWNALRWCAITKKACKVCFRACQLAEGQDGVCRARGNRGGQIVPLGYGQLTSVALDPIEKKPLACYYPDSLILSVGSFGCNLRCPFCQNASISMKGLAQVTVHSVSPRQLADKAEALRPFGNIGVAFTYNEPLVGYEYVRDSAREVQAKGLKNVVVTSGSVSGSVFEEIAPYIDAYNIDLKGFTQEYYDWVGGDLAMTKAFIQRAVAQAHVELTTLIVPGKNDSLEEMEEMCRWIAALSPEIPLHLSRFYPSFQVQDIPPTSLETLLRLEKIARKYLQTVVLGNV